MKTRPALRVRVDTPSARPLAAQARALAERLEHLSLRKSRILWELDMPLSRRCGALAREAQNLAGMLEAADEDAGAVTARLNLTAKLVCLQAEAERLAPAIVRADLSGQQT